MLKHLAPVAALPLLLALPSSATAQTPRLVRDINTVPFPDPSSSPREFVELGGEVYFAGTQAAVGTELFKTTSNPGTVSLVADITPGTASTNLQELTVVGNQLFFLTGSQGKFLWRSDGTAAGTIQITGSFTFPSHLTAVGDTLFFNAASAAGRELWKSDGTAAGTMMVVDLNPGSSSGSPVSLIEWNGELLFGARNGNIAYSGGLFRSDGTAAGTSLIKAFNVSAQMPRTITPFGNKVLFEGIGVGSSFPALWESDGTAEGTVLVRDRIGFAEPVVSTTLNLMVFVSGGSLWRTDGTTPGTFELTPRFTYQPTVAGSVVIFGKQGTYFTPAELWKTDGTPQGTGPLGTGFVDPDEMVTVGSDALFSVDGEGRGKELWRSDGTLGGTTLVADINPGAAGSVPLELTPIGSRLYFSASNGVNGREPYTSDVTAAGTVQLENMLGWTGPPATQHAAPRELIDYFGTVLFTADDGQAGRELWRSDGTAGGTSMVIDLQTGPGSSDPRGLAVLGSEVLFTANSGPRLAELWASDGTPGGTRVVKTPLGRDENRGQVVAGDTVFFVGNNNTNGKELWKSDGTSAGTQLVTDLTPGAADTNIEIWSSVGSTAFFSVRRPTVHQ